MNLDKIKELEKERLSQGLSKKAFSSEMGMTDDKYYYWCNKLLRSENSLIKPGEFVPIEICGKDKPYSNSKSSDISIEIRTTSGTELRMRGCFTNEMLASLLKASGGLQHV